MKHNFEIYIPLQRSKAVSCFEDIKTIRDGVAVTRLVLSKPVYQQDKTNNCQGDP